MRNGKRFFALIAIGVSLIFAACQNAPTDSNAPPNANQNFNAPASPNNSSVNGGNTNANSNSANANAASGDTHEHRAPHDGTLVAFGEEFAHLELVLDEANGGLTAYALDGEAEKSVPLAQAEIEIEVEKPKKFTIKLAATENALTGEKKGATSEFRAASDELKNLKEFDAKIASITIRGKQFKNTHFNFPKGNEDGHGH